MLDNSSKFFNLYLQTTNNFGSDILGWARGAILSVRHSQASRGYPGRPLTPLGELQCLWFPRTTSNLCLDKLKAQGGIVGGSCASSRVGPHDPDGSLATQNILWFQRHWINSNISIQMNTNKWSLWHFPLLLSWIWNFPFTLCEWKVSVMKRSQTQNTQGSPQGWGLREQEIQQMGEEQVEMLAPNPRQDFWDR